MPIDAPLEVPGLKLRGETVDQIVAWVNAIAAGLTNYYVDSIEIDLGQTTLGVKLTIKSPSGQTTGIRGTQILPT